jgi:transcription termination factor NusB
MINIDIQKTFKILKEKVEDDYINTYNNQERDEDGNWSYPSASSSITNVLEMYFEDVPEEEQDEEFFATYNKLEDMLEKQVDDEYLHNLVAAIKENYRGLSGEISNIFETIAKEKADNKDQLIDNKIKELINPYINMNYLEPTALKSDLEHKGFELDWFENEDITGYRITYLSTGECDYFLVKNSLELEKGKAITRISDIIRGIKGR